MTDIPTTRLATESGFYQARDQVLALLSHQLRAFLPTYDRPLMHDRDAISALVRTLQRNRNFRLRLLYTDARDAVERRHELLDMARRLPSYVEMRRVPPEHRERTDTLLIADRSILLYRPDERHLKDGLLHGEPGRIHRALEQFDELWSQSVQESATRLLMI